MHLDTSSHFDMKPSHINGILIGSFLLFAIGYWFFQSSSAEESAEQRTASAIPAASGVENMGGGAADPHGHLSIDALMKRVAEAPQDTALINHLAQLLHDDQRYEEAAAYYNRYLELSPKSVQGWLDLANVYAALKDWDKAIQATQSLLDFNPQNPSAMYNMGAIHANLSRTDEAIYWWTQVRDQEEDLALAVQASQSLDQLQRTSTP